MSTRSTITIINPDMSAMQTTCHWDGYLAFNGVMLQTAYNSPRKASALISHGEISSLGFTSKQSKIEKQVKDLTNFDTLAAAKKLGYDPMGDSKADMSIVTKIDRAREDATNPYTFYYGRDRHPAGEDCEPRKFSPKQVVSAIRNLRKANEAGGYNSDKLYRADPHGIFFADYNYIYDASIASPQWFIVDIDTKASKTITSSDIRDINSADVPYTVYKEHVRIVPLSKAINKDKEARQDAMNIKPAYHDFMKHPVDPSYDEFIADLQKKYGKPRKSAGVAKKHGVKQNIVHQMNLF